MNKKIIAVAIALVLMVAVFAGCGKKEYEQTGETPTLSSETTETTTKDLGADIPDWIVDETTTGAEGEKEDSGEKPTSGKQDETTTSAGIEIGDDKNNSGHVDYNDLPIVGKK